MSQASQALTPPEILDAGHKAESDGRIAYAVQFYRHLTNYYARSPEAADARQALHRLNALSDIDGAADQSLSRAVEAARTIAPTRAAPRAFSAPTVRPQPGQQAQPRRGAMALPPPAKRFRIGRVLALLMLITGGLTAAAGLALIAYAIVFGLHRPAPAGLALIGASTIIAGPICIVGGLLMALAGQCASAIFRMANASTDLAALMRAKTRHDSHED